MYLILYPYLLKVQRNVSNVYQCNVCNVYNAMYLMYTIVPSESIQRNVPNVSVMSESTS